MKFQSIIFTFLILSLLAACIYNGKHDTGIETLYAESDSIYRSGNYVKAITLATEAADMARERGDHYLAGRACELLASIVDDSYGGEDVVRHRLRAASEYLKADSIRDHRYAMIDVAIAYANIDSTYRAAVMLDSLRMAAAKDRDSVVIVACIRSLIAVSMVMMNYGSIGSAGWDLRHYKKFYLPDATDYAYQAIETCFFRDPKPNYMQWIDSARAVAKTPLDDEIIDYALRQCMFQCGDFGSYQQLSDSAREVGTDKENITRLINAPVLSAQRDYYTEKVEKEKNHSSRLSIWLSVITVSAIILTGLGIVFHRMRMRVKNAEIDSKMEALSRISEELLSQQAESEDQRTRIRQLFKERWDTLNLLCNEFFEKGDSEKARASIVNEVEAELERLRTPRKLRQIEDSVNECMDGIVSRLRIQCPFLKEDDVLFLTLVYAGFSPRAVCLFTGLKLKYFYTKRLRLIERIKSSDAPDREAFIANLNL